MSLNDEMFGILNYTYSNKGSGGKIKEYPEDFVVIETERTGQPISTPPNPYIIQNVEEGGLFLAGRAWKRNIDHSSMISNIAKVFGVTTNEISTAGIKDSKAVTVQLFSVYQPKKIPSDPLQVMDGLQIDSFKYIREKMFPGRMGGNYFKIIVRDINKNYNQGDLENFSEAIKMGIPNYYGYQRFGGKRPINASFGHAILQKKYDEAIEIFLGGQSWGDDEYYRKLWRETHDPDKLLVEWKNIHKIERDILIYLSKRNDYRGALTKVPQFLINIAKSAFVSLLFNRYLSLRGNQFETLEGERLSGKNIEIALPSRKWLKPLNSYWNQVFDFYEIDMKRDLKEINHTSRLLLMNIEDFSSLITEDQCIHLSFSLGKGEYATTLLRELIKSNSIHY